MKRTLKSIAFPLTLLCILLCFTMIASAATKLETLKTPAEASNWTRTTSSAEVIQFCETVAANSGGRVILDYTYTTELGTKIPYLIIGKPAPADPSKVPEDKAVVYVNCNIHSGEVEGKEAMLIFAREVAQGKHDDLLKDLVVVICPNSSPDGNDKLGKNRITTQFTPKLVGTRPEGTGKNVNRDMTKIETVCARSIVKLMNEWNPVLFIDAHATDGSYMRHAITYNWGLNAGMDPTLLAYNRDVFCERALRDGSYLASKGKVAVPYGNWGYYYSDIVAEGWRTFEDYARYTTNYAGLRNRLALLLEVYSYDEFSVRVDTQYECIYGALQTVAKDKVEIKTQIAAAEERTKARATNGINPETDIVALNSEMTVLKLGGKDKLTVLSYETDKDGKVIGTRLYDEEGDPYAIEYGKPVDYETDYWGTFVPTDTEIMGAYYLIDADCTEFIETLRFHGVEIYQLKNDMVLDKETFQWYKLSSFSSGGSVIDGKVRKSYEGHYQVLVDGEWIESDKAITVPAGTYVLSTAQTLGSFVALMCEPACVDGGVAWNFFDNYFGADAGTFRANFKNTVKGQDDTVSIPILKVDSFKSVDLKKATKLVSFSDVEFDDWYYKEVEYAAMNGLFSGKTATTFDPQGSMTRGQLVAVLYRLEGKPAVTGECAFTDVAEGKYYCDAVIWASANDIVKGKTATTFAPNAPITRQQMAAFLYRYAEYKKVDVSAAKDLSVFTDASSIGAYAQDAMKWANEKELIKGSNSMLNPGGTASRAQVAVILTRYCKTIIK